MHEDVRVQIAVGSVALLAVFGLISSIALAISIGAPLGDVTPWWIATYVADADLT